MTKIYCCSFSDFNQPSHAISTKQFAYVISVRTLMTPYESIEMLDRELSISQRYKVIDSWLALLRRVMDALGKLLSTREARIHS